MADSVTYLRGLRAIRAECRQILAACESEAGTPHFRVERGALPACVERVEALIAADYADPDQEAKDGDADGTSRETLLARIARIPYHSRWRHFEAGGVDRVAELKASDWADGSVDAREVARRMVDLVIPSVLLDAGAGGSWAYDEGEERGSYSRSEGLGVASFHMFRAGMFSSEPETNPHRADAEGLKAVTEEAVREGFQVRDGENEMVGCEGRAALMRRLGVALENAPGVYERDGMVRPGHLVDYLHNAAGEGGSVSIEVVWDALMQGLELLWPDGRVVLEGRNMGDVWPHSALEAEALCRGHVPFHKLTQWLTYSLLEPLRDAGLTITDTQLLTGLPEYRNGGLLVDLGVLVPKDETVFERSHEPSSELIVEWRALTLCLLDDIASMLRERLNLTVDELPTAKVLEAGTWKAGRRVAKERREDGGPPINIVSDGTVF